MPAVEISIQILPRVILSKLFGDDGGKIHKTEKQAKEEFFLKKVLTRGRNCYIIAHALLRCGAEKTDANNLKSAQNLEN